MKYTVILLLALTCVFAAPVEDDDAFQEFSNGNHIFTAAVHKEASRQNPGNLIVSPFSAETVLALTLEGAKGETASELITGLSLPNSKEKIQKAYQSFLPKLRSNSADNLQVSIANKIYVKDGVELEDNFKSVAVSVYGSGIQNVDFRDAVATAAEINNWVEEQTNHKIQDLVKPDSFNYLTAIVLVNALYLRGEWLSKFGLYPTTTQKFFTTEDDFVETDIMYDESYIPFYENKDLDAKFIELGLKGGDISVVFVLPNQIDGLASLEEKLEQVLEPQPFTRQKSVALSLPRFTTETQVDFVPILNSLGIQRIFSPLAADLSEFSVNTKDLYITDVAQKAFISITEGGLEAAAATDVAGVTSVPDVEFKANHPFLYYVQDNGVILFLGRFVKPTI